MENRHSFSRAAILVAAALWGTSFPVIKFGLEHVDAYQFALIRFIIAAALLWIILHLRGIPIPPGLWWNRYTLALGASNAAGFFLQFAGMTLTGAIETSLLVNSNIVLVMLISARIFGERITARVAGALVLSETGVILLTTAGDLSFLGRSDFLGNILVFLAGLAWVIFIVVNKIAVSGSTVSGSSHKELPEKGPGREDARTIENGPELHLSCRTNSPGKPLSNRIDTLPLMTVVMCLTAVFLAPAVMFTVIFTGETPVGYSSVGWGAIFYVSIFCTAIPFLLYCHGLRRVSAGASGIMLLLEIIVAGLISVVFLGESLSGFRIFGAVLIVVGLVVVSIGRKDIANTEDTKFSQE